MYAGEDKRSPKSILRLFNVAFNYAYLLTIMFKESPSKITKEKHFGVYFHSLTCHLPEISRIIPPSSMHCENEERMFSDITAISRSTSSRTCNNAILRLQAEMEFKRNDKYKSETSKISSLAKACKYLKKVLLFISKVISQVTSVIHSSQFNIYDTFKYIFELI